MTRREWFSSRIALARWRYYASERLVVGCILLIETARLLGRGCITVGSECGFATVPVPVVCALARVARDIGDARLGSKTTFPRAKSVGCRHRDYHEDSIRKEHIEAIPVSVSKSKGVWVRVARLHPRSERQRRLTGQPPPRLLWG